MALVDYPSSDDEAASNAQWGKRKRPASGLRDLPSLPANFHNLYATNTRISIQDDPSLHGGRKRAVPHIEGNWQTHIYLEWYPTETDADRLSTTIHKIERAFPTLRIHSSVRDELGVILPLHISLSAPLVLRTEQRANVLDSVIDAIDSCSFSKAMETFVTGLDWAHNDDASRWFLVLRVAKPEDNGLNRLLSSLNLAATKHGLPKLYSGNEASRSGISPPSNHAATTSSRGASCKSLDMTELFHISIAWTLDSPKRFPWRKSNICTPTNDISKDINGLKIAFEAVKIKIGNSVTSITLSATQKEGTSILG